MTGRYTVGAVANGDVICSSPSPQQLEMLCDALVVPPLTPLVVSALKIRALRSSLVEPSALCPPGTTLIDGVKKECGQQRSKKTLAPPSTQEFLRFGFNSGVRTLSATPLSTKLLALLRVHLLPALVVVQDLLPLLRW